LVCSKNTEQADEKSRAVAREYYGGPSYVGNVAGVCVTYAYAHMCFYFHTCVTVSLYS